MTALELVHVSELRPLEGCTALYEVDLFFNLPRATYAVTVIVDGVLYLCGFRDRRTLEVVRVGVCYETENGELEWEELAA